MNTFITITFVIAATLALRSCLQPENDVDTSHSTFLEEEDDGFKGLTPIRVRNTVYCPTSVRHSKWNK